MQLLDIYRAFGHETRLRILSLLTERPLCVRDLQRALQASQVQISKQLAFLKSCKLVQVESRQNWRIYRLPEQQSLELRLHLECLRECGRVSGIFLADLQRLKSIPQAISRRRARVAERPAPTAEPMIEEAPPSLESHLL